MKDRIINVIRTKTEGKKAKCNLCSFKMEIGEEYKRVRFGACTDVSFHTKCLHKFCISTVRKLDAEYQNRQSEELLELEKGI